MALDFSAWQPYLLVMAFVSMALMAGGYLWKDRRAHLVRAAGWTLFALYWPFQAPEFFWPTNTEPDPINGWFTLLGPIFLLYVAWHEVKSYRWNEDPEALRWFTGASMLASVTYFVINELPLVQEKLIYYTAVQSGWLLSLLFGVENTIVQDAAGESHIYLNGGTEYAVTVILACTAIQSIMIFVGAIACLKADTRRKWKAYLYTVPVIYVLNLFRNAGIVYGYKVLGWSMFGIDPFEWMHSYVGKIGSLAAMVVIALAVFTTLPELHSNILDLFDLRRRQSPGFYRESRGPSASPAVPAPPRAELVAAWERHYHGWTKRWWFWLLVLLGPTMVLAILLSRRVRMKVAYARARNGSVPSSYREALQPALTQS